MAQQRENIFACGKFDVTALLQIARHIRQVPCWCDEGRRPTGGSVNWVIFVFFEDGVEWVFRSPSCGRVESVFCCGSASLETDGSIFGG